MVRYTLGPRIEIILYFNVIYREERSLARVGTRTPLSLSVTRHPDKWASYAIRRYYGLSNPRGFSFLTHVEFALRELKGKYYHQNNTEEGSHSPSSTVIVVSRLRGYNVSPIVYLKKIQSSSAPFFFYFFFCEHTLRVFFVVSSFRLRGRRRRSFTST